MGGRFDDALKLIAIELVALLITKQHNYGQQNILAFGDMGVRIRSNDKMERLKNLLEKSQEALFTKPLNEPLEETWGDIAGYAIIGLMLHRGWFGLPLDGED